MKITWGGKDKQDGKDGEGEEEKEEEEMGMEREFRFWPIILGLLLNITGLLR